MKQAGITKRFTVHGLRYTFTDLVRRANVDAVVRRALTEHVTEQMQRHYSTVGMDEKRAAIAGVLRLAPVERKAVVDVEVAPRGGTTVVPLEELNLRYVEHRFLDEKRGRWGALRGPTSTRLVPSLCRRKWDQRWDQGQETGPNAS